MSRPTNQWTKYKRTIRPHNRKANSADSCLCQTPIAENIEAVPTYYKPTRMRGKRVVYRSIDPDEPRRETMKGIVLLTLFFIFMAVIVWLSLR